VKGLFFRRNRQQIENNTSLPLVEHLEELRTRILRSVCYVALGMTGCWIFYPRLIAWVLAPVWKVVKPAGGKIQFLDLTEPFWLRAQTSMLGGLILVLPLLLLEIWGFVGPALTPRERRVLRLVPLGILLLFVSGSAFGYKMCPLFAGWFVSPYFVMPWMSPQLQAVKAVLFVPKVMLGFGIGFQIPIFIILLNRLGVLPGEVLSHRWREATVAIFTIAAIITPTWDPLSMTIAALPLALLYAGTVWIIALIERREKRRAAGAPEIESIEGEDENQS
jgi:sec-independent protein translocase protein TatC